MRPRVKRKTTGAYLDYVEKFEHPLCSGLPRTTEGPEGARQESLLS